MPYEPHSLSPRTSRTGRHERDRDLAPPCRHDIGIFHAVAENGSPALASLRLGSSEASRMRPAVVAVAAALRQVFRENRARLEGLCG